MAVEAFDCGRKRVGSFVPSESQAAGRDRGLWSDKHIKSRVCQRCSMAGRHWRSTAPLEDQIAGSEGTAPMPSIRI